MTLLNVKIKSFKYIEYFENLIMFINSLDVIKISKTLIIVFIIYRI